MISTLVGWPVVIMTAAVQDAFPDAVVFTYCIYFAL